MVKTINDVRGLVERGILLSPEAARILIDAIDNHEIEVVQFNLGVEAAERGEPVDEPHFGFDTDMWIVGYVWGKYRREVGR